MLVKVVLTRANIAMHDTMAIKKKQQAKKSVRAWMCVLFGEYTRGATVGRAAECVRCVRAAECVLRSQQANASELR